MLRSWQCTSWQPRAEENEQKKTNNIEGRERAQGLLKRMQTDTHTHTPCRRLRGMRTFSWWNEVRFFFRLILSRGVLRKLEGSMLPLVRWVFFQSSGKPLEKAIARMCVSLDANSFAQAGGPSSRRRGCSKQALVGSSGQVIRRRPIRRPLEAWRGPCSQACKLHVGGTPAAGDS